MTKQVLYDLVLNGLMKLVLNRYCPSPLSSTGSCSSFAGSSITNQWNVPFKGTDQLKDDVMEILSFQGYLTEKERPRKLSQTQMSDPTSRSKEHNLPFDQFHSQR